MKGYSQVEGVDYGVIVSAIAKMTSIWFLFIVVVASFDLEVEQMDVKFAFLRADLEEDICMSLLEHYMVKDKCNYVCKLKKPLYGPEQSPGMWYKKFDTYVLSLGFESSKSDHCVY